MLMPYLCVQDTLESVNTPNVFAAGDVCHNLAHPRPKAGVFAVRAGCVLLCVLYLKSFMAHYHLLLCPCRPPLLHNLRAAVLGERLEAWTPQTEFLGILSIGMYVQYSRCSPCCGGSMTLQ